MRHLATLALLASLALFGPVLAQTKEQLEKDAQEIQKKIDAIDAGKAEPKKQAEERGRGYIPLTPEKRKLYQQISTARNGDRIKMLAQNTPLPASFDARVKYPIPTWDQGSCGSCYLVSTVRTMTAAYVQAGYGKPDNSLMLAAQYGMDRPRSFGGCGGGNGTEVIDWAIKHGWIAETYIDVSGTVHNDYPPYEARSGNDRTKAGAKVWMKDATWGFVSAGDGTPTVEEIKAALVNFGRLNIAIDAGGQFGSGTGTITSLGRSIDHEINVVGYDDAKDGGSVLLENQWGNGWGNNGCRWCTYKAAQNIVDWFWVSATPLPPPPSTIVVSIPNGQAQVGAGYAPGLSIATGGTAPYSWVFDWGDGQTSTAPSHVYTAAGTFTISAAAKDATGALGTGKGTVVVTADPIPVGLSVTIPNSQAQVNVPFTVTPVVTGATSPLVWSVNYGDGTTSQTLTHTYTKVGSFALAATVIDAKGQLGSAKATITVTDSPIPIPPPGGYPRFSLDKPIPAGNHEVVPVEVMDWIRATDMKRMQMLNPGLKAPAPAAPPQSQYQPMLPPIITMQEPPK